MQQVSADPRGKETGRPAVELSIVVAADEAGPGLRRCLDALGAQVDPARMEVIVADGSASGARLHDGSQWLTTVRLRSGVGVPHLWNAGMEAAQGNIIALTIEQCVPAPDWTASMLRAHSAGYAAIGGAIEPGIGLSLAGWAIYFCRYSRYMLPAVAEFHDDLAGDNCSYKRTALEGLSGVIAAGFWETFVHRAMRDRGQQLRLDPSIVVSYEGPVPFWGFLCRRFDHARLFAARRRQMMPRGQRWARAAASPIVPLVLLRRIGARVWNKGRRGKFLASLPLLLALLVSWATGEGVGYLFGGKRGSLRPGEPGSAGEGG